MRKGLVVIGVILLIIGLLMMLFMWPIITDAETPEDFVDNLLAQEYKDGDTIKVMGEVTDVLDTGDSPTGKAVTLEGGELLGDKVPFPIPKDFDVSKGDTVLLEYKMQEIMGFVTISEVKAQKVPTVLGIIGLILLIVGIILLIVGAATGRAAPMPPEQPPMEPQPYQPPPGQPYQPPPQQPYQPPPYQQPPPPR